MSFTVLVIEDDPDTRENLRDLLELDGYASEAVGSATEAMTRNDWSRYGAVILDRMLPDGSAEGMLPELCRLAPDASVIIVTGYADVQSTISAFRLGASDYILKPINADELRSRIDRIAEYWQSKRALRQKEAELRAVLDALPVGVWFTDAGGRMIYINPAAGQIWGGMRFVGPEAYGEYKGWWADTGRRIETHEWPLARALRGEAATEELAEIETFDGIRKSVLTSAVTLRDDAGKIVGAAVINHDVTERRRAVENLLKSEERLRLFIDHAPVALAMFDRSMNYLAVSRRWMNDYHLGDEPLIGRNHYDVFPEIPDNWKAAHQRSLAGEVVRADEDRFVRSDGSSQWLRWELHPWHEPGCGVGGIVMFTEDITERIRAESALREKSEELRATTQQLWQSARLAGVGELAAGIAHELNNPLGTVSLRVEGLLAKTPPNDVRRRSLEIIEQEVERMGKLVANLLQFSRAGLERISTTDLCETIRLTLELLEYHLRKQRIEVETEFAEGLPLIYADRQQLRQVFLNLFTNAADAMPDGGRLTVRIQNTEQPEGVPSVAIDVVDTGTGIPPELLPRVFDSFVTTKPEGKGTGLGLAICQRIVRQHRGTINVESQPGIGTTFRIVLPVRPDTNVAVLNGG